MTIAEDLWLDVEYLTRRITFLEVRAKAHLHNKVDKTGPRLALTDGNFHRACAAGLWRDAGALALLREDIQSARRFLGQAGELFAELGLFYGYALLELIQPRTDWLDRPELVQIADLLHAETREPTAEPGRRGALEDRIRAPFLAASIASTRQLTHLFQAMSAHRDHTRQVANLMEAVEIRLKTSPAAPVGPTGMPLQTYLRALDEARHGDLSRSTRRALAAVAGLRAEQLEAARMDRRHWRMALAPTDLLDFDMLSMATLSLSARGSVDGLDDAFRNHGRGVDAPFRAAEELRRDQLPEVEY